METLAIFNPEHDLCLANGKPNFVPPNSALQFAQQGAHWMYDIGGQTVSFAVDAHDAPAAILQLATANEDVQVLAWGWNIVLWTHLVRAGVPQNLLPSERFVLSVRRLSHRATALPLQTDVQQLFSIQDIEELLLHQQSIVLKSPWSGSGRGLRWVKGVLTTHDLGWAKKIVATQGSVMAEPRYEVVQDFAFLFYSLQEGEVSFCGYSLFDTHGGVYRGNWLKSDDEIEQHLMQWISYTELLAARQSIRQCLSDLTLTYGYWGPIGVDAFIYRRNGDFYLRSCVEINFRYTMGFIAHERLQRNPDLSGSFWSPMDF